MSKRANENSVRPDPNEAKAGLFSLPSSVRPLTTDASPDEALIGKWVSEKGSCRIGRDTMTARLSYEEAVESQRLHGWLDPVAGETTSWKGTLALLKEGQGPWYGPSFGPAPDFVGDIKVRLVPGESPSLETQIRVADEDTEFQPPVSFKLESVASPAPVEPSPFKLQLPAVQKSDSDNEKEESNKKRSRH